MQTKNLLIEKRVIEVARDTFASKGYKNTSMQMIANKVPTAVGNLYNYFPSKQALFEAVIGETTLKVDKLITSEYQEVLRVVDIGKMKELFNLLPSGGQCLDNIDRQNLFILLTKCQHSRYASYHESILEMLKDYARKNLAKETEEIFIDVIGYLFLMKLIYKVGNEKSENKRKKPKNIFDRPTTDTIAPNEVYDIDVNHEKKMITVTIKTSLNGSSNWYSMFYHDYQLSVQGIPANEYVLRVDMRKMPTEGQEPIIEEGIKIYHYIPLEKIQLMYTEKQIALGIQYRRIFSNAGFTNVELLIK